MNFDLFSEIVVIRDILPPEVFNELDPEIYQPARKRKEIVKAGRKGLVIAKNDPDDGAYAVWFYDDEHVIIISGDNIMATGKKIKREEFYS